MKLFSNIRAKRSTAFAVLLAWLFAVASGVVNACLLEVPGAHANAAMAAPSQTTHAPAEWAGPARAVAGHGEDSEASRELCLNVCDDDARSIPNMRVGVDQSDPGPAPLVAIFRITATPIFSATHSRDGLQPPAPGQPVRIRYSRLAL